MPCRAQLWFAKRGWTLCCTCLGQWSCMGAKPSGQRRRPRVALALAGYRRFTASSAAMAAQESVENRVRLECVNLGGFSQGLRATKVRERCVLRWAVMNKCKWRAACTKARVVCLVRTRVGVSCRTHVCTFSLFCFPLIDTLCQVGLSDGLLAWGGS